MITRFVSPNTPCLLRVFCLSLLLVAGAAPAQNIKIGFVDIPYLIDEAPQSKAASSRLESEFAPRQEQINEQKQQMDEINDRLKDSDRPVDESERSNLERELRKIQRRVKRDEQEFREELNIQKNQEFKRVRVSVLDAIASFARNHNYDLILSDGVLFANKRIDVTKQVLLELQQAVSDSTTVGDK